MRNCLAEPRIAPLLDECGWTRCLLVRAQTTCIYGIGIARFCVWDRLPCAIIARALLLFSIGLTAKDALST